MARQNIEATDTLDQGRQKINANDVEEYAHISNTSNPHSVTKAQVGLSNADNTSDPNKPVSTAQQTALDLKANKALTINQQTDSYTLVLSDADTKLVDMNKATALNLTVPLNATVAFPIGTIITVKRSGSGLLTIVATGGVTINSTSGVLTDAGLNVYMTLVKTATNTWDLQNGGIGVWTSYVPTFTGFSVQPTGIDSSYTQIGPKTGVFRWDMTAGGTSNATTFTMTMPFIARSRTIYPVMVQNAGTYETQQAYVATGSNIISFARGALAFTASGVKASWGCIVVEIQ